MEKLSFYDVDIDYIEYLKTEETKYRGYTKVPNIRYENNRKFLCGIVLKIAELEYYVPISSYKEEKSESFLIVFEDDKYNKIKGSLRFNYMIPVPKDCIEERIINDEKNINRKIFLQKQLEYINSNINTIKNRAERTYLRVINNYNPHLTENSCDFEFLEGKCREYILLSNRYIAVTSEKEDNMEE